MELHETMIRMNAGLGTRYVHDTGGDSIHREVEEVYLTERTIILWSLDFSFEAFNIPLIYVVLHKAKMDQLPSVMYQGGGSGIMNEIKQGDIRQL